MHLLYNGDVKTFQDLIHALSTFWSERGCAIHQGHDVEVGAGTFNPATFMRSLGPEPYKAAYTEISRRPQDARYGDNPNRLGQFHQYQVIFKPSPENILELYLDSLAAIGLDQKKHDIRFVHDDWESPTLGASGLGWEVWCDGMEITQFTYFQTVAGIELDVIPVEITYGLERLCMYLQNVDNVFDIQWNDHLTLRDIAHRHEIEWSHYNFEYSSPEMWIKHFDDFEAEAKRLADLHLPLPAYDFVMKASHAFNMIEARGLLSVTERTGYIARIRDLACLAAHEYLASREKMQFPLLREKPAEEKITSEKSPLDLDPSKTSTFLFEIGTEPLPAAYIPAALKSLEQLTTALFKDLALPHGDIRTFATPKRLAIEVKDLPHATKPTDEKRKGPPVSICFDENGEPTKQGAGFLKSLGLDPVPQAKLPTHITVENGYLFAHIKSEGKATPHLLAETLPKLIAKIPFPKKMRWNATNFAFARPIKTLVALQGQFVIPFSVAGVTSGKITQGDITIPDADTYLETLKSHDIIADHHERERSINDQLAAIEKETGCVALETKKLLRENLYLTESPHLTTATFDKTFLTLPNEVITSEMVHHQKYFPLAKNGKLTNTFVITCNCPPTDLITAGNVKVVTARLSDGVFLYKEDRKKSLFDFAEKLSSITFHAKLGTLADKTSRLLDSKQNFLDLLDDADPKRFARAATLCKADLATALVGEFPDLQGVIGHHYALADGEDEEVASTIEDHYHPRFEGDTLPKTVTGTLLALSDKCDTLNSYYSVGIRPTSSGDPYALRRQAIGVLRLLIENKIPCDLEKLLPDSDLRAYLTARTAPLFDEYGFSKTEIAAILPETLSDPYDTFCRLTALHNFRKTETFPALLEVYKRAKGQLAKQKPGKLDPTLFTSDAAKSLHDHLNATHPTYLSAITARDYETAFYTLASYHKPLAHLFTTTKILDPDPKIAQNRLALLDTILTSFTTLLNLSKL